MTTTSGLAARVEPGSRSAHGRFDAGLDDSAGEYRRRLSRFASTDRILEIGCGVAGGSWIAVLELSGPR